MAIAGKSGSLYVGATPAKVAEISGWSLDLGGDNIDTTNFDSNGWKEYLAGLKEWSGSAEGNFKFTDTTGQKAIYDAWAAGTSLSAEFRLGTTSPKFSGAIFVSSVGIEDPVDDKITVTFDFQGSGALTYTV
ncbi:MAG: phage tail tube protein [Clostridia bacterium]|nr:phage tail tube protein [Clostridia bacterium]